MRNCSFGVLLLLLALFSSACQESGSKIKPAVLKFSDLAETGVRVGIVDPDLGPAGRYALDVLERLKSCDAVQAEAITDNIITHESHVRALLDKLMRREIDAGFIYRSDALSVAPRLAVIEIPTSFSVSPEYALARIQGTLSPEGALHFIDWLMASAQLEAWLKYGFKPPPPSPDEANAVNVTTAIIPAAVDPAAKLTIFAAAVFYDVLRCLSQQYMDLNGVEIVCEFAGSGKLYQKIAQGAQGVYGADVFLSAAPRYIAELERSGRADHMQIFMRNDLVIGVVKP